MSQQLPDRFTGGAVDLSHLAAGTTQQSGASPVGEAGAQQIEVPALVFDVTDQSFDQIAQLSAAVPVVFSLWSPRAEASATLNTLLEKLVVSHDGRLLLALVDVDANPGLAQAFQAQAVPTAIALLGGRPVPLFQGLVAEEQVRDFFTQLVQLAQQQGMQARAVVTEGAETAAAEPAFNPAHADALAALERGDYAEAIAEYEKVLLKAPADAEAHAALVQVKLLKRLEGFSTEEIRSAAAAAPESVEAQLRVADLDVSGGHVEDAFGRLLDLFAATAETDERTVIREHLVELFEVVGVADPRVIAARRRLANLLF